ncbi:aminotransferase class III-fold pyridoxal phosphate-dependent enzyme [Leptobacterium flavescens]|uniref:Aminotransferase class III-fold pyridoxal phosphate-dependent enzyme n=1 Tax=Leptobacterium flavescens TaxID=472055 RepID=A0A6P0UNJ7_9FLAO|nr:aminotransferase class III-fold pyridoxal phosphate-dependent enzyme [Leptobacterium flavescens]NER14745.1 aminotransferase class III-fold pyridoxal phosphate-dependent enzyme [Leptobacterium flavescens]
MELFDVYPLYNVSPLKAEGLWVYDKDGEKYLDLYGGHAVISIGHSHPHYIKKISAQLEALGFYSNAVQNPLQKELAAQLGNISACDEYQLFLCNSGAEANENALKLASFHTGRSKVVAFKNGFHGRTSAAVAATDNPSINSLLNAQHQVDFVTLGDLQALEAQLAKGDVCAVIFECIQGVGGLDEASGDFYNSLEALCRKHDTLLIADEVQSGYGRTGDFFAFQKHGITPDIISMAKGMGNGFPIGGILIHPKIEAKHGMLGTTFGGNHLACAAGLAVLEVMEKEQLMKNTREVSAYFKDKARNIPHLKDIKGRGLMLGLEFDFAVAPLRKKLIHQKHIFTGGSANKNLIRILPPLNVTKEHIDLFIDALSETIQGQQL